MKRKWLCIVLAVLMLIPVAPVVMADPEIDENSIVTIVNVRNSANVREQATSESNLLGVARRGKTYKLLALEGEGKWYKIQYTSDKVGYVFHLYVKVGKKGDTPLSGTATVVKKTGRVNIRSKPSTKGDILGAAVDGDTFEVKGKSGNWIKVAYGSGTAYIHKKYLKLSTTVTPPVNPGETGYIANCKTSVNVRASASSKSDKLCELKRGTKVTVTAIEGNWSKISYSTGVGYVYSKFISATNPDDVEGKTATIVNCHTRVNVRASASSKSTLLGTADLGSTWKALARSGNWVKVQYGEKIGFIHKRYVKIG